MTVVDLQTYTASVVLPYPHASCATAGLRAELRHRVVGRAGSGVPDWSTLLVTGPTLDRDARGRVWYEYTATLGAGGTAVREDQQRG